MRTKSAWLALLALSLTPIAAGAITVSLDTPDQSVARPSSGTVAVDFYGSAVLGAGEHLDAITGIDVTCPYQGALFLSCAMAPIPSLSYLFNHNLLFTVTVDSTAALGLYDSAHFEIRYHNLAGEPDLAVANYSVDVGSTVPEPGTLALLGIGFVGMLMTARRKAE